MLIKHEVSFVLVGTAQALEGMGLGLTLADTGRSRDVPPVFFTCNSLDLSCGGSEE